MSLVIIRPMVDADLPFIRSSWLKSWRRHTKSVATLRRPVVPDSVYWSDFGHSGLVDHLLHERPSTTVVAHAPATPDVICGWCCFEALEPVAHYLLVAKEFSAPEFRVAGQLSVFVQPAPRVPWRVSHDYPPLVQALAPSPVTFIDPYREYGRSDKHGQDRS